MRSIGAPTTDILIKRTREKLERDEEKLISKASECYRKITFIRELAGARLVALYKDKVAELRYENEDADRGKARALVRKKKRSPKEQ